MEGGFDPSFNDRGMEALLQQLQRQHPSNAPVSHGLWPLLMSTPNHDVALLPYQLRQHAENERAILLRALLSDPISVNVHLHYAHPSFSVPPIGDLMIQNRSLVEGNHHLGYSSTLAGLANANPPIENMHMRTTADQATSLPDDVQFYQNSASASHQQRVNHVLPTSTVREEQARCVDQEPEHLNNAPQGISGRKRKLGSPIECRDAPDSLETSNPPQAVGQDISATREYNAESFAQRLFRMISDQEGAGHHDTVEFLDGGGGFWLHNQDKLVNELMPTYFRARKFSAFRRQLVSYGFKRESNLSPHRGAFKHPLFSRGKPELCKSIVRDRRYDRRNRNKRQQLSQAQKQTGLSDETSCCHSEEQESGSE